ncbi:MAG: ATP-binding cassette domain-containing protein [Coriobacteriales bacterium]|jgi:putative ABC transport system ATP-binding protein|nr:ATP-binding cassette domain-containing protein [Coriobacteriales bacterium]
MLLQLCAIGKDFGTESILKDVTLTLERGQSLAVVAPSGAGKSTLLSIAGLLLEPSEGTLLIDGEDAAQLNDNARSVLRAEKIGFLFQHTQLIGALRASENASVPANFIHTPSRRMSVADRTKRAKELLGGLGLEDRLHHYPYQLSVGQKRRVATARALFLDPPLVIADEPTNDLDAENARIVTDALFGRVLSGEAALLYATHDESLAARADRVLAL